MTDASIPMPHDILAQQDTFGSSEVGITHPVQNTHIRLRDNGDVELIAGDNLAIVMSNTSRTITFVADSVKFMTKAQDGFRWNDLSLNPQATNYHQPAFVKHADDHVIDLYSGFDNYVTTSKNPDSKNPWKGNV